MLKPIVLALALAVFASPKADAKTITRSAGETARKFAERALNLPADSEESDKDAHVLETTWNGKTVVFVDYLVFGKGVTKSNEPFDKTDRVLVGLEDTGNGDYRKFDVTVGEEEGGAADIAAIGFANADKDPAKELIVIVSWIERHAGMEGTAYEVRIFDDAKPGQPQLPYLKSISRKFGGNLCDCEFDEGTGRVRKQSAHYKTIADVKKHLKELGF